MIYYPISTLMLAGIQEILIITTPYDQDAFKKLLGDGSEIGINFTYRIQPKPEGLAQALIIGEDFLRGENCLLILGDNIFHGAGLGEQLHAQLPNSGSHIFTYEVSNPSQYGVLEVDNLGKPIAIQEKPQNPRSNLAVTGLYFFDGRASRIAKNVKPSNRGELEITSVIEYYLENNELSVSNLSRVTAWLDTGNPGAMQDAASYIRIIEDRTGLKIGCLEEVALLKGWIDMAKLKEIAHGYKGSSYGNYLEKLVN
jgi:glucose-1-phosphate thymidylyltransferase